MIEMLVCGLMAYYHVDCIQFIFYETPFNQSYPGIPNSKWLADSEKDGKIGIVHIYDMTSNVRDACGNTVLQHEMQRFKQNRWDTNFCNIIP